MKTYLKSNVVTTMGRIILCITLSAFALSAGAYEAALRTLQESRPYEQFSEEYLDSVQIVE